MNQRRPGLTPRSPLKSENMTDLDIFNWLKDLGLSTEAARSALLLESSEEVRKESDERTTLVYDLITAVMEAFGFDGTHTSELPPELKGTKVWGPILSEIRSSSDFNRDVAEITHKYQNMTAKDYCQLVSDMKVMTLNDVVRDTTIKPPVEVFGHFIHKGNIGLLFGESNAGKSVLAYEMGLHYLSSNPTLENEQLGCGGTNSKRMVIYYDFEMNLSQVHNRYMGCVGKMDGCESFILPDTSSIQSAKELLHDLRSKINRRFDSLCVIDNITKLDGFSSERMVRFIISEMKQLVKAFPNVTILMLTHIRNKKKYSSIELGDVKGVKVIASLVDAVFALGNSRMDEGVTYVKHLKSRDSKKYDYVARFDLVMNGYLQLQFISWDEEELHVNGLSSNKAAVSTVTNDKVLRLLDMNYTVQQIAKTLRISMNRVMKIIKSSMNSTTP